MYFGSHDHWYRLELVKKTLFPQCPWNMVALLNTLFSVMVIAIW